MKAGIDPIRDESGTTLVELVVGMAVGLVVLSTLTTVIIVTLHGSARVSARVEATQNGRIALARVMEELHSACVAPKVAPVQAGSTGTSLRFIRAAGNQGGVVAPNPTLTEIKLEGGTLSQTDYAATGGAAPTWTFSGTAAKSTLMKNVSPLVAGGPVFSYYSYSSGALSPTPLTTPLDANGAALTVQVKVAFVTAPGTTPVKDAGASSAIQDSAILRLTPPSFNEQAVSLPCQ
jgi:hypothetical protein